MTGQGLNAMKHLARHFIHGGCGAPRSRLADFRARACARVCES